MSKVLLANASLLTSLQGNEAEACGLARTRPGTDRDCKTNGVTPIKEEAHDG